MSSSNDNFLAKDNKTHIAIVLGTRPEAIKLAPLILELKNRPEEFKLTTINTGQHQEMAEEMLSFFGIKADINLKAYSKNRTPDFLVSEILNKLSPLIEEIKPDKVIVQGDTASAYSGALAAFLQKIKLAHVEAGLRTNDLNHPFPEEAFRVMIDKLADLHFAATENNKLSLIKEGIQKDNIFVTGNTGIDSLHLALNEIESNKDFKLNEELQKFSDSPGPKILLTAHRRENLGIALENIANAVTELSNLVPEVKFLIPLHPNLKVREVLKSKLKDLSEVILTSPFTYPEMCIALKSSNLVLTDSGGLQEEAPSLNKKVLILRKKTERIEGVKEGISTLLGNDTSKIVSGVLEALEEDKENKKKIKNPYGDGLSAGRIADLL